MRREHTETFIIQTDSDEHSPYEVSRMARRVGPNPLPALFDRHPHDNYARVKNVQVTQDDSTTRVFKAVVKYDTTEQQTEGPKWTPHPLQRPPKYQLELMQFERVIEKDIYGNAIVNSIGQPFDPPLMHDDCRQVLVATRNIGTLGEIVQLQQFYKDAINVNPFYGARPRQAKVMSITAGDKQKENNVEFYEVTIRVAFKEDGGTWVREVLNQGMGRLREADNFDTLTTKGDDGEFINTPILLRLDGTQITQEDINDGEQPTYLKYHTYPERDFRGLGI